MLIRLLLFIHIVFIACAGTLNGQEGMTPPANFKNPVIPGFHPDPSICRVGEDYYLVTSSFEWFPGVPIYHSRDLVNWRQIGNVLSRPEQLNITPGTLPNKGIWAPSIRYHDGTFYMITTLAGKGNFFVTAKDPAGPWSDPVWLPEARGIDPSLFWDDDGRCWYTGAGRVGEGPRWPNQNGAWIQEIDLKKGRLIGQARQMTYGHASNARWTEGPHLYKIDGRYLLMVAEGGTGIAHSVTVFESDSITGPYTPSHINPVLTHRHLGKDYPIGMLGHADLVQTQQGDWWAVLLGRRVEKGVSMLARETFLVPVSFEDGWPVFNPGIGKVLAEDRRPDLPWHPFPDIPVRDDFNQPKLAPQWNFLRTPTQKWYGLGNGVLKIDLQPEQLSELNNPALIGRRIQHFDFNASTQLRFSADQQNEEAGLTLFLDNQHFYTLVKKGQAVVLTRMEGGVSQLIASRPYTDADLILRIEVRNFEVLFRYGSTEKTLYELGGVQDARVFTAKSFIGTGFNGPYVGMYAGSNGQASQSQAVFDYFDYEPLQGKGNDFTFTLPKPNGGSAVYPQGDGDIHINDLIVHDPCILADKKTKTYYIYEKFAPNRFSGLVDVPDEKAGIFFQSSKDLIHWSRPRPAFIIPDNFWADDDSGPWAPEVHEYQGKYYLFTTFNAWDEVMDERPGRPRITRRASQVLVADKPSGPFRPLANRPTTPEGQMTLDATFWLEDGQPWMVYCHEWVQLGDGLIKAIRLSEDLATTLGEPITLLDAGRVSWTKKEVNYRGTRYPGAVTDGPYFYRTRNGRLLMLWSSWTESRKYATAVAVSESGKVTGPWKYDSSPILQDDRGHAMIFEDFEGRLLLSLHRYFQYPHTRVQLYELKDTGDEIRILGQILGHH